MAEAWDDDINNKGKGLHPRLTRNSLQWYKKIFADAATSASDMDRHMFFIRRFGQHRDLPVGKVSGRTYLQLIKARHFDEFCRMIYKREETREEAVARVTNTLIADEDDHDAQRELEKKKILTPIWRIGYKPVLYNPVATRKHQNNVLNSEGNEVYFSYNGDWKDGKMHGSGIFQFADGHRYEGCFEKGWMHGPCTVTYPTGAVYQGFFKDGKFEGEGKRHGRGRLEYSSGMYYEGDFYVGKFHGRGKIHSPTTGFTYEGAFEEGAIRGYGVLWDPEGNKEAAFWGGLAADNSFTGVVEQVHRRKIAEYKHKLREDDERYALIRSLRLKEFVATLKQQIAQDRYDQKREKMLAKRRKAKDLMDVLKSKPMSSGEGEAGSSTSEEGTRGGSDVQKQEQASTVPSSSEGQEGEREALPSQGEQSGEMVPLAE